MILVHASPTTLEPYRNGQHLGILSSPRRFYANVEGWSWAADNDAFSAWDEDRYRAMLDGIADLTGCLFVTAPDVVGDAPATMELFHAWKHELERFPIALVGQDGLEHVPWDDVDAFFIGGSDEWKMGADAARLAREAHALGKHVHMGRVNGHQRIRYAKAIGCDSIDGTSMSWFRDRWLPEYLAHAAAPTQEMLG